MCKIGVEVPFILSISSFTKCPRALDRVHYRNIHTQIRHDVLYHSPSAPLIARLDPAWPLQGMVVASSAVDGERCEQRTTPTESFDECTLRSAGPCWQAGITT